MTEIKDEILKRLRRPLMTVGATVNVLEGKVLLVKNEKLPAFSSLEEEDYSKTSEWIDRLDLIKDSVRADAQNVNRASASFREACENLMAEIELIQRELRRKSKK